MGSRGGGRGDKTGNGQHGACGKMRLFLCALSTRSAQNAARLAHYDHAGALQIELESDA